jgi:hypothetical protein
VLLNGKTALIFGAGDPRAARPPFLTANHELPTAHSARAGRNQDQEVTR